MLVRKWPLNDLTGSEPRASILRSDFSLIWIVMVMMMMMMIVVDIVIDFDDGGGETFTVSWCQLVLQIFKDYF